MSDFWLGTKETSDKPSPNPSKESIRRRKNRGQMPVLIGAAGRYLAYSKGSRKKSRNHDGNARPKEASSATTVLVNVDRVVEGGDTG